MGRFRSSSNEYNFMLKEGRGTHCSKIRKWLSVAQEGRVRRRIGLWSVVCGLWFVVFFACVGGCVDAWVLGSGWVLVIVGLWKLASF